MPDVPDDIFATHRLCGELKRDFSLKYSCSKDDERAARRSQWRDAIALAGRFPFTLDAETAFGLVEVFLNQVVLALANLEGKVVFVGVEKKGMALLNEIVELVPTLKAYRRISDSDVASKDLQDCNIIIIDDIVNHGVAMATVHANLKGRGVKGIRSLVLLARQSGLQSLAKEGIPVDATLEEPDDVFSTLFILLVSPLLRNLRNGAISNWPHRVYRIGRAGDRIDDVSRSVLRYFLENSYVDSVSEVGACDGSESPIYHGTLLLPKEREADLMRFLEPDSEISQVKLRFFIGPYTPLTLHLCSIVWPITPTADKPNGQVQEAAESLLSALEPLLRRELSRVSIPLASEERQ